MKAIILNSGIGSRLKPITDDLPKCLINLDGKTILEHQIESMRKVGIDEIIITTGHLDHMIESFVKEKFPNMNIKFVKSDDYKTTNYIFSIWLARHHLNDDIIMIHGDMVYDHSLLKQLIDSGHSNSVLINKKPEVPEKDFKAEIINGRITKIGVSVFGDNARFLAPIYKISKDGFAIWLNEISNFIERGDVKVYAENAFNNISHNLHMKPVYYENEFCMEIDNHNDLEIARNEMRRRASN